MSRTSTNEEILSEPAAPESSTLDATATAPRRREKPDLGGGMRRLYRRVRTVKLSSWFVLLSFVVGTYLVFAQPPGQGLDEANHFFRVWEIAHGEPFAPSAAKGVVLSPTGVEPSGAHIVGGRVPVCYLNYFSRFQNEANLDRGFSVGDYWRSPSPCSSRTVFTEFENTALDGPVSYLPKVIAVAIVSRLGAPVPFVFFFGRFVSLLAFIAMVWGAIRIAPIGKEVFFVLGLLPTSLLLAASYSSDPMIIGLAFLGIALTLRCCLVPSATWRSYVALVVVLAALATTKNTLLVFAALTLMVPASVFGRIRHPWLPKIAGFVVIAGCGVAWYLASRHITLRHYLPDGPGHPIDPSVQTRFIFEHPLAYLKVLLRTTFDSFHQGTEIPGFFSSLGYYRPFGMDNVYAPLGLVLIGTLTIFYAYQLQFGARRLVDTSTRVLAWIPVAVMVVGVLLLETAFWIGWTPPGQLMVTGGQGRYYIPYVGLPLITIGVLRRPRLVRHSKRLVIAGVLVMLVWIVLKIVVHDFRP